MASLKQLEMNTNTQPETLLHGGLGFLAGTIGLVIFQRSGTHQRHEANQPSPHNQG